MRRGADNWNVGLASSLCWRTIPLTSRDSLLLYLHPQIFKANLPINLFHIFFERKKKSPKLCPKSLDFHSLKENAPLDALRPSLQCPKLFQKILPPLTLPKKNPAYRHVWVDTRVEALLLTGKASGLEQSYYVVMRFTMIVFMIIWKKNIFSTFQLNNHRHFDYIW